MMSVIIQCCFNSSAFPNDWKKSNITIADNSCCPVLLLPICSKIFEKLVFDNIFAFLKENRLLNSNQSGFTPHDSCINQLLSITHNIFSAFDANRSLEVRGVFLDFSKAFGRVWHEGLLYKLKKMTLIVSCIN